VILFNGLSCLEYYWYECHKNDASGDDEKIVGSKIVGSKIGARKTQGKSGISGGVGR
jgi:hypothetical protein